MGLQESPAARRGTPSDALARRLDAIDSELRQLREELGRDPGDTFAP